MLARFWISSLPLLVLAVRFRREIAALLRRHPLRLILLGLLGVPSYHLTFNIGTRMLSEDPATAGSAAMLASILVSSVPAWTALIGHLVRLEFLSRRQWLGQGLALAGVVFIATRGDFSALRFSKGALWTLGAPVSWACYSLIARPLLKEQSSSLPLISCAMIIGTLAISPFAPAGVIGHLAGLSAVNWIYLLFAALLATFTGYMVYGHAIRRMNATRASTYIYFIPVTSIVIASLLADERVGPLVLLGGLLTLTGVILIQRGPRRVD